jgi:hypothetical protein
MMRRRRPNRHLDFPLAILRRTIHTDNDELSGTFKLWTGSTTGLKVGVPFTQYFETGAFGFGAGINGFRQYSSATRRYTFGASGEWRLNTSFGFEVDAMYHRMGYVGSTGVPGGINIYGSNFEVKGNSWDFPVMAKYRFGHVVRPYVAAGGVLRHVGPVREQGENTIRSCCTSVSSSTPIDTTSPPDLNKRFYPGVTAASGIEIGIGRFRVLPEFRYTRWIANISAPCCGIRFASNQAELIVGLLF